MDKAENKFKILVNENSWDTSLSDKNELMALRAELEKLKKAKKKPSQKTTKKSTKKRVDISRKPKDIHKPVIIDGKPWYWCSPETGGKCSGALRRHKPQDCKGMAKNSTKSKKRQGDHDDESGKRPKLKAKETLLKGQGSFSDDAMSSNDEGN